MPKIKLKPNSPEFVDDAVHQPDAVCDMPGCQDGASHRAPKDRSLGEYYDFCLTHVQEYNKAWDYFSGMSPKDIEDHIIKSALWDRPTWRFDKFVDVEEELKKKAWQSYHFTDKNPDDEKDRTYQSYSQNYSQSIESDTPEFQAMAILGLEPPLDLTTIKKRYKELAKKYHPDVNQGNKDSEELLKNVNMAYTILKMAFEKYEKLEKENK